MRVQVNRNSFVENMMEAFVIGYNHVTKRFVVCDLNGAIISYNSIHSADGRELNRREYESMEKLIKKQVMQELSEVINNFKTN